MAELRLIPLGELLDDNQINQLQRKLEELGVKELGKAPDDFMDVEESLSEEQLTDFLDRLEAHEIACDIYLSTEFEGRVEVSSSGHVVGSAHALADALEEIRDELDLESDDAADDEELELQPIEVQLLASWRSFAKASAACLEQQVPMHVIQ